jgi:hypothetical protein
LFEGNYSEQKHIKMSHRKPLIRRTFLQERYEILIKRQQSGKATFNELTELDDIVNRDPSIREIVLIENHFIEGADDNNEINDEPANNIVKPVQHMGLLARLKLIIHRIFTSQISVIKGTALLSI